jgi:uncharacterized membrane protein
VTYRNRMAIAVLSLVGLFVALYLTLHRVGVIGTLACGVDGGCSTVQTSSYATFLGLPVPFIGLFGYVILFGLAMTGVRGAWDDRRTAVGLLALATIAFGFSMYLTAIEAFVIGAWCRWCIVSAVIATLIFLCSLPEAARLRRESTEP